MTNQLSPTDIAALRDAAVRYARETGTILMGHFRQLDEYEHKGAIDIVTRADRESEAHVLACLARDFAGHGILAEESGASGDAQSEYLWVIDPLDGTTNFAHGIPNFAVSIAVQHRGRTVAGAVNVPAMNEMYAAGLGLGATRNGERIAVSRVSDLERALLVTGFPYDRRTREEWLMATLGAFLSRSQGVLRLGAAAYDLALVAAGHFEGFYEINLHPWDMAAGALLVEEAGGRMSTFTGAPFHIRTKAMLASNGALHEAMMGILAERPSGLE